MRQVDLFGERTIRLFILQISLIACIANDSALATERSSTVAIHPRGDLLAAVNTDSGTITLLTLPDLVVQSEIMVGQEPQMVAFDPSGDKALVTNRWDDTLSIIDLSGSGRDSTVDLCDEPVGVVTDDRLAYVSCHGDSVIALVDPASEQLVDLIDVASEPRGLALSPDASRLYVTHFSTGRLSIVDLDSRRVIGEVSTGLDSNLSNAVIIDANGTRAWLPQTRSDSSNPALVFDATVFPIVSVIELESMTHLPAARLHLDLVDEPVNMPLDAALVGGSRLHVLNAGSNDLSVIDLGSGETLAHLELGHHPRGMALSADERFLYVNNSLSGTVSRVNLNDLVVDREVEITKIELTVSILNGKRLFNSANRIDLARDQWISCATCHFDGTMDRRTWFFPDGPRNTTSLLGVSETLPIHWSGNLDELQDVESTVREIQAGTGLAEGSDHCSPACDQGPANAGRSRDLDDLAAYMASLQFPPNPNRTATGRLTTQALKGQEIFESEETGCAGCHVPPLYTDRLKHEVGTAAEFGERRGSAFDTPSLRGIYATAPYLHDGSAPTLLDVLRSRNEHDLHGKTSHLSTPELEDLTAFLNSIGGDAEYRIGAEVSGAWLSAGGGDQALYIGVDASAGRMYVGWALRDDERGVESVPRPRLVLGQGPYTDNRAELHAALIDDAPPQQELPFGRDEPAGSIRVEFSACNSATMDYELPALGLAGVIEIARKQSLDESGCETP